MACRWVGPLYRLEVGIDHIAVPQGAGGTLHEMADEMVGTDGLISIYLPEGTEGVYAPGAPRGWVARGVRLPEMPEGGKVEDSFYEDRRGSLRWPVGSPCEAAYSPPVEACPVL